MVIIYYLEALFWSVAEEAANNSKHSSLCIKYLASARDHEEGSTDREAGDMFFGYVTEQQNTASASDNGDPT
jgi:hypothetical protein